MWIKGGKHNSLFVHFESMMSSKSIFEIGTDSSKQLLQEGYTSQEANGLQQLLLATALHGTQHAGFSREVNIGIVHINKT